MSDLAFLSSDEEESIGNDNSVLSNISDKKTSLKKDRHNSSKDDDEHSSDEEFGNDFEFGGMLVRISVKFTIAHKVLIIFLSIVKNLIF